MSEDSLLVFRGGECKALGSGRVGGRLVVFDSIDKVGDVFHKGTNFFLEDGRGRVPVFLEHGLHPETKMRQLGRATITTHDDGLHIHAELQLKDAVSRSIYQMVESNQLSWSSGSAPHLVTRTQLSPTTSRIDSWVVVEGSLTRTPCENLAVATALKSFAAHATFENLLSGPQLSHQQQLEMRAAQIHVRTLIDRFELSKREFERSQVDDERSEMQKYYDTLAQLSIARYELVKRG